MKFRLVDPNQVERSRERINSDPEFKLAARFMSQDFLVEMGSSQCIVRVRDGVVTEIKLNPSAMDPWSFAIRGPAEFWEKFLQPLPPPFYNGLFAGIIHVTLKIEGNLEAAFAHFWAINRMFDIMRQLQNE